MARDTVTVPKSLERKLAYWLKGISSPEKNVSVYLEADERQAVIDALLFTARESLSPSSDPEGGARGVQGSIATKQESCPESAPRTETAFHFHRFVKGQERAEGVMICRALSLQDAFYVARKLYNYPNNMDLVLAISDSEVAILRDIARTSVALSECHKEIAKLREQLLSHSTGEH